MWQVGSWRVKHRLLEGPRIPSFPHALQDRGLESTRNRESQARHESLGSHKGRNMEGTKLEQGSRSKLAKMLCLVCTMLDVRNGAGWKSCDKWSCL